jgi:hypothetical protein
MDVEGELLPEMESVRTIEEVELDVARRSRKKAEALVTGVTTRRKPRRWKAKLTRPPLRSPLKRPTSALK